jgi:hypothetical protein
MATFISNMLKAVCDSSSTYIKRAQSILLGILKKNNLQPDGSAKGVLPVNIPNIN